MVGVVTSSLHLLLPLLYFPSRATSFSLLLGDELSLISFLMFVEFPLIHLELSRHVEKRSLALCEYFVLPYDVLDLSVMFFLLFFQGQFVVHELGTPLSTVDGFAPVILRLF